MRSWNFCSEQSLDNWNQHNMNISNITVFVIFVAVKVLHAKRPNINHILRIQMARLQHQYDMEKNTKNHQLKDKDDLEIIRKKLMQDFWRAKEATIQRVRLQKLRSSSLKMARKRIRRSDIQKSIGSNRLKLLRKFHS